MLLAQKQYQKKIKEKNNAWNFGPRNNSFVTVNQIINKIKKVKKFKKITVKRKQYLETKVLRLNSYNINEKIKMETKICIKRKKRLFYGTI